MSVSSTGNNQGKPDFLLQQFLEAETQKLRFQSLVHELTDHCWEVCLSGKPPARIDPRTESCLSNCVERFLDTAIFVENRPGKGRSPSSELLGDN